MAYNFGFNRDLMDEVNLSRSVLEMPEDQYNLAELASGFNRKTLISPIHAAALAAAIANDGQFVKPRLIKRIYSKETQEDIWSAKRDAFEILTSENAFALKQMMELTVSKGTARSSFRRLDRKVSRFVSVGGKTGSISGGMPDGKRDWFTAFAVPKDQTSSKGISVSVMIVNDHKWHVKSSYMAKEIIEYYFKKIHSIENAYLYDTQSRRGSQGKTINGT